MLNTRDIFSMISLINFCSWEEAAAIPLTGLTAWEGLVEGMGIQPRDQPDAKPKTLLVIAGAGGKNIEFFCFSVLY